MRICKRCHPHSETLLRLDCKCSHGGDTMDRAITARRSIIGVTTNAKFSFSPLKPGPLEILLRRDMLTIATSGLV